MKEAIRILFKVLWNQRGEPLTSRAVREMLKKKKNPQKHVMDFEGRQRICQVENVKTFWAEEQLEQVERAGKVCVFWKTYGSSEG